MKILLSPIRADWAVEYIYGADTITAVIDEMSDTFDFSGMPNGQANDITTTLPRNPVVFVERTDGILSVVLLNPIGPDATEEEKFPEWLEV